MERARRGSAVAVVVAALAYPAVVHVAGCDRPPPPRPPEPSPRPTASASASASASMSAVAVQGAPPPCSSLPPVDTPPAVGSTGLATPGLSPGLAASAGAALRATCARIEATVAQNLRTYPGYRNPTFWSEGTSYKTVGRCFASPRGAWILEQSAFRVYREASWTSRRARWELVYVTPEGKAIRGGQAKGEIEVSLGERDGDVEVLGVHDFDGDGVSEVLLRVWSYAAIDGGSFSVDAYTLRDGAAVAWGTGTGFLAWIDLDRDGRPEMLGQGQHPQVDIPRVLHALPAGSFSEDDAVARSALRQACPAPPAGPLGGDHQALCARLWGAPLDDVERRVLDAGMEARCTRALLERLRRQQPAPTLSGVCALASAAPAMSSACERAAPAP